MRASHTSLKSPPFQASITLLLFNALVLVATVHTQDQSPWKQEVINGVESRTKLVQEMVDSIFSLPNRGFRNFARPMVPLPPGQDAARWMRWS